MKGQITRSVSGIYHVQTERDIFLCRARGILRKQGIRLLVGDYVEFTVTAQSEGIIDSVYERKNQLIRPAVANVDMLCYVMATVNPAPHFPTLDRMTVLAQLHNLELVIILNKTDLGCEEEIIEKLNYYKSIGYSVLLSCAADGIGMEEIRAITRGKTAVFSGNTGVGKSSVLSALDLEIEATVGEISQKLGRGRHTTREVTLYNRKDGGQLFDTPGFGQIDLLLEPSLRADDLKNYYKEFLQYSTCQFADCTHSGEQGCAIITAVKNGKIAPWRMDSYGELLQCLKKREREDWNGKK